MSDDKVQIAIQGQIFILIITLKLIYEDSLWMGRISGAAYWILPDFRFYGAKYPAGSGFREAYVIQYPAKIRTYELLHSHFCKDAYFFLEI